MGRRRAKKPVKTYCEHCGKRSFPSWDKALASVVRLVKYGAPPLRIYQCEREDAVVYHMTSRRRLR